METIQLPNQFDSPNIGKTEMIYLHGFQNPQQSDSFADSFADSFFLLLFLLLSFIFFSVLQHRALATFPIFFSCSFALRALNMVLSHHWNPLIIPTFSFFSNKRRETFSYTFYCFIFDC